MEKAIAIDGGYSTVTSLNEELKNGFAVKHITVLRHGQQDIAVYILVKSDSELK